MNRQISQNEKLDRIARALLEAAKMRDEEIEKIVSAPNLFASVQARISAEQKGHEKKSFFGNWLHLSFPNLQRMLAFSALFFLCFGVFGFVLFSKLNSKIETVSAPEFESIQPFEFQPEPESTADFPEIPESQPRFEKTKTIARKIVQKTEKPAAKKSLKTSPKQKSEKVSTPAKSEPNGEFYALNYAGNLAENGEVLQVVRAELSPSSLFALGVNLPIENAPEKIKTDLLVGSDGIARAIRFVE
jgi:hypothetical protein